MSTALPVLFTAIPPVEDAKPEYRMSEQRPEEYKEFLRWFVSNIGGTAWR